MSSQIANQLNIHPFRLILPSSLCIFLRPSRHALSSRQTQCSKRNFFNNTVAKFLVQGAPVLPRDHNSDPAGSAHKLTVFSSSMLPLNPFQSFVLHGTVAGGTTRPNNPRFVPVPVDVWSTQTFDKRAPGDIFSTNTRCNSTKVFCRTATPQSRSLETTHGIRALLGRCDDPNHRWWTGSNRPRFRSFAYATALTKVRPPFCVPTDRVFRPLYKGVPVCECTEYHCSIKIERLVKKRITVVAVGDTYVCECTVGVDVGDGSTHELTSIPSNIAMGCIVLGRQMNVYFGTI